MSWAPKAHFKRKIRKEQRLPNRRQSHRRWINTGDKGWRYCFNKTIHPLAPVKKRMRIGQFWKHVGTNMIGLLRQKETGSPRWVFSDLLDYFSLWWGRTIGNRQVFRFCGRPSGRLEKGPQFKAQIDLLNYQSREQCPTRWRKEAAYHRARHYVFHIRLSSMRPQKLTSDLCIYPWFLAIMSLGSRYRKWWIFLPLYCSLDVCLRFCYCCGAENVRLD